MAGLFFVLAPNAVSQEETPASADPNKTRIALGVTSGTPGTSVVLPIYFTPAAEVTVGEVKLEVNFVSVNVELAKLERGLVAELGAVDLRMEQTHGKNESGVQTTTATITTAPLSTEPPEDGIPIGLLGYLHFRIGEDANPAKITVRLSAEATDLKTKQQLPDVLAYGGSIEVDAPGTAPLIACFFFTH